MTSDHVLRHNAFRVDGVIVACFRFGGIAIAAQVRRDDREVFGKAGRHLVPDHVGLRITVKQQKRRPFASRHKIDFRPVGGDAPALEPFKHGRQSIGLDDIRHPAHCRTGVTEMRI